ncbi:MAG: aldo/keto reductase [Chloroflexi bacterium]|nr:aldo/keto reductase [Chloroflexota bacterium]
MVIGLLAGAPLGGWYLSGNSRVNLAQTRTEGARARAPPTRAVGGRAQPRRPCNNTGRRAAPTPCVRPGCSGRHNRDGTARYSGPGGLVCNQVLYHLWERHIEHGVLPWCESHGVAVTAYSPFGHGHFPEPGQGGWDVLARIGQPIEIAETLPASPRCRPTYLRVLFIIWIVPVVAMPAKVPLARVHHRKARTR